MVSLDVFIDIILPVALGPWGRLRLNRPGIFPGGKSGQYLTNLPHSYADCLETWKPQPPGTLWHYQGL
jgi:hypothetical protein